MQIATHIKNTHRPDAPGRTHLPVRAAGDREETTGTGWPELMAVGVENRGHESGPLWRYVFSSCLRRIGKGCTHVLPINIGAQVLGLDVAHRLNANAKAKTLPQLLTDRHCLAKVANGGTTTLGECFPILGREAVEICA